MKPSSSGDYTSVGFDEFLSRSIDETPQTNLESQGPQTTQIRYDASQVSGFVGDTFKMGPVRITSRGILMSDDSGNDVLLIGEE